MIDLEERDAGARQPGCARVVARAEDDDLPDRQPIDREPDEPIEIRDAQREPHLHRREHAIEPQCDLVTVGAGEAVGPRVDEQRLSPFARARTVRTHHQGGLRRGAMDVHTPRVYHFLVEVRDQPVVRGGHAHRQLVRGLLLLWIPRMHVGVILAHQLAIRGLDLGHVGARREVEHAIPFGDLRVG